MSENIGAFQREFSSRHFRRDISVRERERERDARIFNFFLPWITEAFQRRSDVFLLVVDTKSYFWSGIHCIELKSKNSDDVGDVAAPLISRTSHPDNFLSAAVVVDAERNFADSQSATARAGLLRAWALKKESRVTIYCDNAVSRQVVT